MDFPLDCGTPLYMDSISMTPHRIIHQFWSPTFRHFRRLWERLRLDSLEILVLHQFWQTCRMGQNYHWKLVRNG